MFGHVLPLPEGIDDFLEQLPPFELELVQVAEGLVQIHKAGHHLLGSSLTHG